MNTSIFIAIIISLLSLSGCGSVGAYSESKAETHVSFSEFSNNSDSYLKKPAKLKVAETGSVSGSTLLYSAQGASSSFEAGQGSYHVTYPLWINESEVDEVEFAIDKYRDWQAQLKPSRYATGRPINEYVSEWMTSVTFKFGLLNGAEGKPFLSVCYEFSELGTCTFTYMLDGQSVELLSDDLQKFKQHSFESLD